MPVRVIRDPNHPDFPHGTSTGKTRGCTCAPCHRAHARRRKQRWVERQLGHRSNREFLTDTEAEPYVAKLARIRDALGGYHHAAEHVGLGRGTVYAILAGTRKMTVGAARKIGHAPTPAPREAAKLVPLDRVRARLAQAIHEYEWSLTAVAERAGVSPVTTYRLFSEDTRAVALDRTVTRLEAALDVIEGQYSPYGPTRLRHDVWTYQAAGWPISDLARRVGVSADTLHTLMRTEPEPYSLFHATAVRLRAGLDELAGRAPGPGDGVSEKRRLAAAAKATAAGYYPPAAYNEDGTLDWSAIPDHPWTRANERAGRDLDFLHLLLSLLRSGATVGQAAVVLAERTGRQRPGCHKKAERMLSKLRLGETLPGYADRRALLLDVLTDYQAGFIEPVALGVALGLDLRPPKDHPALAEVGQYEYLAARLRQVPAAPDQEVAA